jgi:hypothetical protein
MANFIKGAIKHPGAATAAAKAEGLTVHQWAVKHQHDAGTTGRRARLALTLAQLRPSKSTGSALAKAAARK